MLMKPHKFQEQLNRENPNKFLLPWRTGTGKTFGSILWAEHDNHTLIIVPKHLKEKWMRDLKAHSETKYTIITKETFSRDKWDGLPACDGIIVDEAHYFSGMKSTMSKNLLKYIKKHEIKRIALLTATPYLSTPWNIYRLATILGYKWNYWEFSQRFFYHIRMGSRMIPMVRPNIEDEIAELVRKISFSIVTLEDLVGEENIPDQIFKKEVFALTASQKRGTQRMKEEESNPAVRYNYIHQIENGSLKGDEFRENEFFEANKNERVLEYAENNKKLAVFCRYNLQIDLLAKKLKEKGKKTIVINGKVKSKDPLILEAESLKECVVLINAQCSEGYQLPSFDTIIFASLSFSLKDYTQAIGRFLRYDAIKKNVYIHLVNEGTIDDAVYQSIMRKEDFDIAIYDSMDKKCEHCGEPMKPWKKKFCSDFCQRKSATIRVNEREHIPNNLQ